MERTVAIVGAGITGLATAYYLEQRAREKNIPLRCMLLESSPQPGGKISTRCERDFVVEGGPDSFVTEKPWALNLCHALGLADELIPINPRENKIYMLNGGTLTPFPKGFRLAIPTRFAPLLGTPLMSMAGKARMAMEYFLPPRTSDGDESVGDFISRRFGREAVDVFGGPLMAGIYVSDPYKLSMQVSFPRFLDMEREHGSLIRAARRMKKSPPARRPGPSPAGGSMFNSLKGGMYTLVEALREKIEGACHANAHVRAITRESGRWRLVLNDQQLFADDIVMAIPAHRAVPILRPIHPALGDALAGIRFVSSATVSMAFLMEDIPTDRPLDGLGVIVPARENRKILACTWSSTKFKHRVPAGAVMLRAFVGGHRDEALAEQDEDAIIEMVRDEFAGIFGISAEPMLTAVYRWPKGNPQFDVGHLDRVAAMERMVKTLPGMHLAGSSYHGVGIPDCIRSALRAVDQIIPDGGRSQPS